MKINFIHQRAIPLVCSEGACGQSFYKRERKHCWKQITISPLVGDEGGGKQNSETRKAAKRVRSEI